MSSGFGDDAQSSALAIGILLVYFFLFVIYCKKWLCCGTFFANQPRMKRNINAMEQGIELPNIPKIVIDKAPEVPIRRSTEFPAQQALQRDFLEVPTVDHKHVLFEYSMQDALRDCGLA